MYIQWGLEFIQVELPPFTKIMLLYTNKIFLQQVGFNISN